VISEGLLYSRLLHNNGMWLCYILGVSLSGHMKHWQCRERAALKRRSSTATPGFC